jgi:hypothetical protein
MVDRDTRLQGILDASGFPFQLGLEQAVQSLKSEGWVVTGREHPWRTDDKRGYIDLVVSKGTIHVVVECKRSRDAAWLFLLTDEKHARRSHARICWTDTEPHGKPLTDWGDIQVYPASTQSEFCAIRGQGEKDVPLLERLASSVTESTEGLARHFLQLGENSPSHHVLLPTIVTNADLAIGRFRPEDVDLHTGDVLNVDFTSVQHLRFRKSLSDATVPFEYEATSLEDLAAGSVRTVFVVQSTGFTEWLRELQTSDGDGNSPWANARRIENASVGRSR